MAVYLLPDEHDFPDPREAGKEGLLAFGGDLHPYRLLKAYSMGIFPWFSEGDPIMWWSPDPRMILFPDRLRASKSLVQAMRNRPYEVRFDFDFSTVISHCAAIPRSGQKGTWITPDIKKAYNQLFHMGFAHSVEVYMKGCLAGGLYGISLGRAFFGESMFHLDRDASKIALFHLVQHLRKWEFRFIDAQTPTDHLARMGAENIPRSEFLDMLSDALKYPTRKGKW
ncbi:MAG: leucyl/phenylalanyl-tRNA--protein transferase [Bacteroidales bacterium]|nr:leucyl/phenylalanyl-tRNA--protein transferase [Bacteroidales bacterium]